MKNAFKFFVHLTYTIALSSAVSIGITNPKLIMGYFNGSNVATDNAKINSDNVTTTTENTTTIHNNNNTITINADGFAVPSAPITLSQTISPDGAIPAPKELSEREQKKLGKSYISYEGDAESFVNGSFTIGLNKIETIDDIRFANISVYQVTPPHFKVRTGWTQDFETQYGTYRLVVEEINSQSIHIATYAL